MVFDKENSVTISFPDSNQLELITSQESELKGLMQGGYTILTSKNQWMGKGLQYEFDLLDKYIPENTVAISTSAPTGGIYASEIVLFYTK
ncbi:MAG: hypothetical protein KKH88_03410 [Nanoarchaeota archaeon]|nr:hypothetical protein [Nanoarchaeota archaeon]MBU1445498.1 hypothetical protein [Nanoarchaeota archaeon]MBU2406807.1 hypothetical protein [Nanoarchaeota archaeon]MBU2420690.1 hypothetical protein [Nanoarchaeota archaeon]MBU2475669.1 hypothetical protein [Nanoarchaeota archaeon]